MRRVDPATHRILFYLLGEAGRLTSHECSCARDQTYNSIRNSGKACCSPGLALGATEPLKSAMEALTDGHYYG